MRHWRLPAVFALCLALAACANAPAELEVRGSGPDGCEYSGPSEISNGSVELLASPSGLGHILAVVYRLEALPTDGQIGDGDLGEIMATVENEDDVNLARRSEELDPGDYAVACVHGSFDGVVGTFTVLP